MERKLRVITLAIAIHPLFIDSFVHSSFVLKKICVFPKLCTNPGMKVHRE
ncbi:MAG TPA: hypothetical protein VGA86_07635 [Desulfatiglandales bacterium]